jgi:DNA ligase (NAD+)
MSSAITSLPGILSFASDETEVFSVLETLDTAYEAVEPCINPLNGELVTDEDYDLIRQAAEKRFPKNEYFKTNTGSKYKPDKIFKLRYPMTSLKKFKGATRLSEYLEWVKACRKELGPSVRFAKAYKIDGTGVALEYQDGVFMRGGIRPRDSWHAEDKTINLREVIGIPATLPIPVTCTIRGELYVLKQDFIEINAEIVAKYGPDEAFKNERNFSTGSLRHKDPAITKSRRLRFLAHSVVGLEQSSKYFITEVQRAKWCSQVLKVPHVRTLTLDADDLEELNELEKGVDANDKRIDGIVVMVDDLEQQEQMGTRGGKPENNPIGKNAWKLTDKEVPVHVGDIITQTGRTGKQTYVGLLDPPVQIAGSTVSRVSFHNLGIIRSLKVVVGSDGLMCKSGDIIPYYIRTTGNPGVFQPKMVCPSCGHATEIVVNPKDKNKQTEYCVNVSCPAQLDRNLLHYLRIMGVKDVGPSAMETLTREGLVKKPGDFYRLTVPELQRVGFSERESLRILAGIHMIESPSDYENPELIQKLGVAMQHRKVVPLWVFFASFGIKGAGMDTGKCLMNHFKDFNKIRAATRDEMTAVDNIGDITAQSVRSFFDENSDMISDVFEFIEIEALSQGGGKLDGYTFVLSGSMTDLATGVKHTERDLEKRILALDGKVSGSISKKMANNPKAFLVAGEGSGSKLAKATELGVQIIAVSDLVNYFGDKRP